MNGQSIWKKKTIEELLELLKCFLISFYNKISRADLTKDFCTPILCPSSDGGKNGRKDTTAYRGRTGDWLEP